MTTVAVHRPWRNPATGTTGEKVYFWCPGCDQLHGIEVKSVPLWTWDGSLDNPTVSPSLMVKGVQWPPDSPFHRPRHLVGPGWPTVCHSFIQNGNWVFLPDCTHNLKGQTVPIPPFPDGFFSED